MRFAFDNGDWSQHIGGLTRDDCKWQNENPNAQVLDSEFQAQVENFYLCLESMQRQAEIFIDQSSTIVAL